MTEEQQTVEIIRMAIKALPEDDQIRIKCIAGTFRNILKNEPLAGMAFALVGAEAAAQ